MLIKIFKINNSNEFIFKNKINILSPPIKPPKTILVKLTFLLRIILTTKSKIKSKPKFRKTKDLNIFSWYHLLNYKKYKLINLSLKRQNKKNMIKHVFKY